MGVIAARIAAGLLCAAATAACIAAPDATPTPTATPSVTVAPTPTPATRRVCPTNQVLSGAITGKVAYPAEGIPPLALYAIRVDGATSYRVLHTEPARGVAFLTYTMLGVEPGTYVVIAYVPDNAGRPTGDGGGYTPAVACGLKTNCTDHALIRVAVRSGQTTRNVDVLDWYAPPGTFPAPPTGGEPFAAGDRVAVCNPFADEVNLRTAPGTAAGVTRTLPNGVELNVTDGPRPADGYDWYAVRIEAASGWVVGYALRR